MADPLIVSEGELGPDELIRTLHEGRHVVVHTEMLGSEHEVTLRYDGEIFYCDTPTQLHKHRDETEMRTCIENQGYARDG